MNMAAAASLEEKLALARGKADAQLHTQALALLEACLREGVQAGATWLLYGETLFALSRFEEAVDAYKKALSLVPDRERSRIWCALGLLYQKCHSPAEAKPWFHLATREDAVQGAWVLRGQNLVLMQDYDEAIRCFSHATTLYTENYEEALLQLALAYRSAQDYRKALRCAEQLLRKYPQSAAAKSLLADLMPVPQSTLETA